MRTKHASRLLAAGLGSVLLSVMLLGCGVTTAASGSSLSTAAPRQSTLFACTMETEVQPIDTIRETLICTVSHAASSETSFTVQYTVTNNLGQPHAYDPACSGKLQGGSGRCAETYSVVITPSLLKAKGSVSGFTYPTRYPLGPVVPTPAPAPAATPSEPLLPLITPTPAG